MGAEKTFEVGKLCVCFEGKKDQPDHLMVGGKGQRSVEAGSGPGDGSGAGTEVCKEMGLWP